MSSCVNIVCTRIGQILVFVIGAGNGGGPAEEARAVTGGSGRPEEVARAGNGVRRRPEEVAEVENSDRP